MAEKVQKLAKTVAKEKTMRRKGMKYTRERLIEVMEQYKDSPIVAIVSDGICTEGYWGMGSPAYIDIGEIAYYEYDGKQFYMESREDWDLEEYMRDKGKTDKEIEIEIGKVQWIKAIKLYIDPYKEVR